MLHSALRAFLHLLGVLSVKWLFPTQSNAVFTGPFSMPFPSDQATRVSQAQSLSTTARTNLALFAAEVAPHAILPPPAAERACCCKSE